MISTKGRYALRVMVDLAEHREEGYIPLKDIALRQEVSKKYLEIIVKELVKGELVTGISGRGGRLQALPEATGIYGGRDLRADGRFSCSGCLSFSKCEAV